MKIAIATNHYPLESFLCDLVDNLKTYQPVIFANKSFPDRFNHKENKHNKEVHTYLLSAAKGLMGHIDRLSIGFGKCNFFEDAIINEGIKLIHAQFTPVAANYILLSRKMNIPLIVHCRGQDVFQLTRNAYNRTLLRILFNKANLFLTTSIHMKKHMIDNLGCPENKIINFYGGVDLNKFKFIERKKKENINIIMCGRLVEKKGFPFGIKAFHKSYQHNKNIAMNIIGDGPLKKHLEKLIKKLKLEKVIAITGRISNSDVAEEISKADILMMPYITAKSGDSEGLPNIVKEAMASGLPIISSYHAGVPEIVKNKVNGFLVKEKDIEGLSYKLNLLINSAEKRISFGIEGRKEAEKNFDITKQSEKLEEIYTEILKGGK